MEAVLSRQPARPTSIDEFHTLFDAEFSYVCRVLRRLGVPSRDLEDVAQETFLAVHKQFDKYDRARPVRPWLFAFAFRVAANHQRLARHRREVSDDVAAEQPVHDTPERAASDREEQDLVLRALSALPFERRTALVMHDLDGFSAPEIAETLSVPLNTVYSRVRIAREEFRKAIGSRLSPRGES